MEHAVNEKQHDGTEGRSRAADQPDRRGNRSIDIRVLSPRLR